MSQATLKQYEQMYVIEMVNGDFYVVDYETCKRIRHIRVQAAIICIDEEDILTRDIRKIRKAKPEDVFLRKVSPALREMISYRIKRFVENTGHTPKDEQVALWIDRAKREGAAGLFV